MTIMSNFSSTVQLGVARAVPALLAAACCVPALAQDEAQAQDSSSRAVAAFMQEAQARHEASVKAGILDGTPPILHHVRTSGSVNAQALNQFVTVTIKVTDDLSGVASYLIEYRSPSGMHHVSRLKQTGEPRLNLTSTLTVGSSPFSDPPFMKFAEPGTWVADKLMAMDVAGNSVTYSEAQLRGYGDVSFFVTNNGPFDIVPPQLASGVIDTPNIRLSKAPPGTPRGTPPFVNAELSITDSGNGIVSGSYAGNMKFCLPGCSDSFIMSGIVNRTGLVANTLTVGTQLRHGQTPGNYQIDTLELIDVAGSHQTLTSNVFGGGTDFNNYFPEGVHVFLNQ
jgi:hypothetical protein